MSKVNIIYNGPEHSDIETEKIKSKTLIKKTPVKTPNYNKINVVKTSGVDVVEKIGKKDVVKKDTTIDIPNEDNVTKLQIKTLYNKSDNVMKNVHPNLESLSFNNIRNPKVVQNEGSFAINSIVPETVQHYRDKRNYKLTPESIFINKEELVNHGQVNTVYKNTYNTSTKSGKKIYNEDNQPTDIDLRPKFSNNKLHTYTEYGPSLIKIKVLKAKGDLPEPKHIQTLELL